MSPPIEARAEAAEALEASWAALSRIVARMVLREMAREAEQPQGAEIEGRPTGAGCACCAGCSVRNRAGTARAS